MGDSVSDDELRQKCRALLAKADLATTTGRSLRKQLAEEYGCDLKDRKAIIGEEIEKFLVKNSKELAAAEPAAQEGDKPKRRPGTPCEPSAELRTLLGLEAGALIHRCDAVRGVHDYIKSHTIPLVSATAAADGAGAGAAKRAYEMDDALAAVFEAPLTTFTVGHQIGRHLTATAPAGKKSGKKAAAAAADGAPKRKLSGFAAPQILSDDLAAVVGQPTASRGEVTKLLWARIKARGLQDENDRRKICVAKDPELRKVLPVDKCQQFAMSKHLVRHFLGPAPDGE